RSFEWGADGRGWRANPTQTWGFSTSTHTRGAGAPPLGGRGGHPPRQGGRTRRRARARRGGGRPGLRGSLGTSYRKITLTPPSISDLNSFNHFLNTTYYRTNADTTVFPDSVVFDESQDRAWELAGGASWRLTRRGAIVGLEYHQFEVNHD